jgi:hypothetical protein
MATYSPQAGLLAFGSCRIANRLPRPGLTPFQWHYVFASLADYSGGPAPDLHRFPF